MNEFSSQGPNVAHLQVHPMVRVLIERLMEQVGIHQTNPSEIDNYHQATLVDDLQNAILDCTSEFPNINKKFLGGLLLKYINGKYTEVSFPLSVRRYGSLKDLISKLTKFSKDKGLVAEVEKYLVPRFSLKLARYKELVEKSEVDQFGQLVDKSEYPFRIAPQGITAESIDQISKGLQGEDPLEVFEEYPDVFLTLLEEIVPKIGYNLENDLEYLQYKSDLVGIVNSGCADDMLLKGYPVVDSNGKTVIRQFPLFDKDGNLIPFDPLMAVKFLKANPQLGPEDNIDKNPGYYLGYSTNTMNGSKQPGAHKVPGTSKGTSQK